MVATISGAFLFIFFLISLLMKKAISYVDIANIYTYVVNTITLTIAGIAQNKNGFKNPANKTKQI